MATSSTRLPFYKTIRFKLTFLYSLILYLFSSLLVFSFNIYINTYLKRDPSTFENHQLMLPPQNFTYFSDLKIEEKERIRQIRLNDLKEIQTVSVLILIPLAVISFSAGYYISGKFLNPLGKLRTSIEELETKDLGIQLNNTSDDEVGAVITSFNILSAKLQNAFQGQEQFVQNASHEIRTPLTIIQTNIDTVLDNNSATKEEMQDAMKDALGGVKQLNKLVNYLLELTKEEKIHSEKILLNDAINSQLTQLKTSFENEKLYIDRSLKQTDKFEITVDKELIERVFYNLFENALKYATRNKQSTIHVSTERLSNQVKVMVTNDCAELKKEQIEKLFDRFYQVDSSRSKKMGGYGLGLAIAKKIVTDHNGQLEAEYSHGRITFVVTLPV